MKSIFEKFHQKRRTEFRFLHNQYRFLYESLEWKPRFMWLVKFYLWISKYFCFLLFAQLINGTGLRYCHPTEISQWHSCFRIFYCSDFLKHPKGRLIGFQSFLERLFLANAWKNVRKIRFTNPKKTILVYLNPFNAMRLLLKLFW